MRKTTLSGSNMPKLAVYNLSGLMVATSYKRHASGKIEFWHFRDKRLMTMQKSQFEKIYQTRFLI